MADESFPRKVNRKQIFICTIHFERRHTAFRQHGTYIYIVLYIAETRESPFKYDIEPRQKKWTETESGLHFNGVYL